MLLNDDLTRLQHVIEAAIEAISYVKDIERDDFEKSRPLQHSVVRCIEIIGEASSPLSAKLRESNPQVPWTDIISMRNRIVHAYFDIDTDIVWKTATEDLPYLLPEIEALAEKIKLSEQTPR
jgi:uncharacterized protein with HEPN domain